MYKNFKQVHSDVSTPFEKKKIKCKWCTYIHPYGKFYCAASKKGAICNECKKKPGHFAGSEICDASKSVGVGKIHVQSVIAKSMSKFQRNEISLRIGKKHPVVELCLADTGADINDIGMEWPVMGSPARRAWHRASGPIGRPARYSPARILFKPDARHIILIGL